MRSASSNRTVDTSLGYRRRSRKSTWLVARILTWQTLQKRTHENQCTLQKSWDLIFNLYVVPWCDEYFIFVCSMKRVTSCNKDCHVLYVTDGTLQELNFSGMGWGDPKVEWLHWSVQVDTCDHFVKKHLTICHLWRFIHVLFT